MMSANESDESSAADTKCCASCGVAEVDEIKLNDCDGCDLVRYCSDACQQLHRPEHESQCKERAAKLRDELLFRQPESTHLGDCPICLLPLPLDQEKSMLQTCCSKVICKGCSNANDLRLIRERMQPTCPFCRHIIPKTPGGHKTILMKRVEANDPVAICHMGSHRFKLGDYDSAFENFSKAAALGDALSHFKVGMLYRLGQGVEKDEEKARYHFEEAAIAGHPQARILLSNFEMEKFRLDRAAKHFIIAANLGCDQSIFALKESYKCGFVSKDDFAAALRAHHAAVDATKSPQREAPGALRHDSLVG